MAQQWAKRGRAAWAALLLGLAAARAADVVPDLDKVEGIKQFNGPPAARELLKRNGFVVVPRFYHQIFSPYIHSGLPPFITTDSLHRTFHVIFEEQIKRVETTLADDVAAITKAMLKRVSAAQATDAQRLACAYFLVAERLLSGSEAPADAPKEVAAELALIRAAAGVARSPVFGYDVDYSQFKPRGFYTETPTLQHYFRAMSWYGNAAFRLVSDRETRAAMLIAEAFAADKAVQEKWQKADRLYTHLIAPADDLTPAEYAETIRPLQAMRILDPLDWFRKAAGKLRDPKINSMVIPPHDMPRWRELSKGLCFFGKRYVPDSEVFMNLIHPAVPGRLWPSGLDVMAVLGSARARELQDTAGEAKLKGYAEGFAKSRKTLDGLLADKEPSHYVETLKLAQTLLAPPGPEALPFMKTPAYGDKNLMTALAMWTSLRHTWQLQAKQSVAVFGRGPKWYPGWVEPNFAFYEQLHKLILQTVRILRGVADADEKRLEEMDTLVLRLAAIGRKQCKGEDLTEEEAKTLKFYGPTIAGMSYFEGDSWMSDRLPRMSLVADVHTALAGDSTGMPEGACLEEAVGAAMPIYVVVPCGGKLSLMAGGAYSYYEFKMPLAKRLTDKEWRRTVSSGTVPPGPVWNASFIAPLDVLQLIERIKKGEEAWEAQSVNSPELEAFLERATAPGGGLDGQRNLAWAVELYGLKAGDKAASTLLDYLAQPLETSGRVERIPHGGVGYTKSFEEVAPRMSGAAKALCRLAKPEHLQELEKIAIGGHDYQGVATLGIVEGMEDKAAEKSLMAIAKYSPSKVVKGEALRLLAEYGSIDLTPQLQALYGGEGPEVQAQIVKVMTETWAESGIQFQEVVYHGRHIFGGWGFERRGRWPQGLTEAAAKGLVPKVKAFVRAGLASEHPVVQEAAREAAESLGIK